MKNKLKALVKETERLYYARKTGSPNDHRQAKDYVINEFRHCEMELLGATGRSLPRVESTSRKKAFVTLIFIDILFLSYKS